MLMFFDDRRLPQLKYWLSIAIALQQIGTGSCGQRVLFFGFDPFANDQGVEIVDDLDQLGEDAPDAVISGGLNDKRSIEFHDVGFE